MKKDSFMKDALVLTAITLISGLLLGVVYGMTKDTIANAIKEATNKAYKVVLDAADYDSEELKDTLQKATEEGTLATDNGGAELTDAIVAKDASGETVGYVLKGHAAGYGGPVVVVVGVDKDLKVTGISFPETLPETAGLGQKATLPEFYEQFTGKTTKISVKKGGGAGENEIDAISGATNTSTAVTNTVNASTEFVENYVLK